MKNTQDNKEERVSRSVSSDLLDRPLPSKEIELLFHELWTVQVGVPGYDKNKWRKLRDLLFQKGIAV